MGDIMKKHIKEFVAAAIIFGCFIFKTIMLKLPLSISYFVIFGWPILEFLPLVIALIIVTYKYLSIQSILKTLVIYIPFQFAYLFLYAEGGIPYLLLQPLMPLLILLVFFVIIKWVCKCKIKINLVFLIIIIGVYILYILAFVLSTCLDYLNNIMFINNIMFSYNQFFSYLDLLTIPNYTPSLIMDFTYYATIIAGLVGMSVSIPAPVKKSETELEAEEVLEIEGMWRCLGCGEYVPNEKDRCECGYKR